MRRRFVMLLSLLVAAVALPTAASTPALAAVQSPTVAATQTLTAPDAAATDFGAGFGMDEQRLAAAATLGGTKVVYIFDRQPNGTWAYSATIAAPAGATNFWGTAVAVSGDTIAVADPSNQSPVPGEVDNYGAIDVFDRAGASWPRTQQVRVAGSLVNFASNVWLTGDTMVVERAGFCDASCSQPVWLLYERDASNRFALTLSRRHALLDGGLTVDVDRGLVAVSEAAGFSFICLDNLPARLSVHDSGPDPASVLLDETIANTSICNEEPPPDAFRRAAISSDVLVDESCCVAGDELHVRRRAGAGYGAAVTVPVSGATDVLLAVPGVILRADRAAGSFHTHVFANGTWATGTDIPFPAGVTLPQREVFARRAVVATGPYVGLRGVDAVHVLTVLPAPRTCFFFLVTVDLSLGQVPGAGNDVILGTGGHDVIDAGLGNDVICGGGGNDYITGGDGTDIALGEADNDYVAGGRGRDALSGGDGTDIVSGNEGRDFVYGGAGDDWLFGGVGRKDLCDGQAGINVAFACETVVNATSG